MKKTLLLTLTFMLVFLSGCATWKGIKKDSSNAWETTKEKSSEAYESTKEAIHDATR